MARYLVIGSGGREHALAWRLAREGAEVFVAPGSDAIARTPGCRTVPVAPSDHDELAAFAKREKVDLTIVGPEAPLCAGLADLFVSRSLPIFGPRRDGARLEGSKTFAKEVMRAAGVPTAAHETFTDFDTAREWIESAPHPLVIKADGLAAGKGVVISEDVAQSVETLREFLIEERFGEASGTVVVEEFLRGPELSFMVITDGERVVRLPTSQDHKRLLDGDRGPNTGGMGAVTPSPWSDPALEEQIETTVIHPVLRELRTRGIDYRGFLYAGLMLTDTGPKVLEFNVRLGDPETQALLFGLSEPLGPVLEAAAREELTSGVLAGQPACCVVLAAAGYPTDAVKGATIEGLTSTRDDAFVFHAGTARDGDRWVVAGGRVLGVTARGASPTEARSAAYDLAGEIRWDGRQMRLDIGRE